MWKEASKTLKIAGPIILGDSTMIALDFMDSAMVGAIHSTRLAAASLVFTLLAIPYVWGFGMVLAISPLVARARGQGSYVRPMHVLFNGFLLCGLTTLVVAVAIQFNAGIVFHMKQDPVVARLAKPYLVIMGWSMIPMMLFLAVKQFSDALEHTRVGMVISLAAIPVNFFLNWVLIYGRFGMPRYELLGAGIGTFISRWMVLIAMLAVVLKGRWFAPYRRHIRRACTWSWRTLRDLLHIGVPSALQYTMETGAFALSGLMIGWMGATQLAAHQVAISLARMTFNVSLGLSAAGAIRIAHAYGRKEHASLQKIGFANISLALGWGLLCTLFFILLKGQLPYLFNDEAPVVEVASTLLVITALFQVSDSVQAVNVGLLRGLHDVRIPTLFVGIAYWVIGLPLGYWLAFPLGLRSAGVWIGLTAGLTASALLLTIRFAAFGRRAAKGGILNIK